MFLWASTQACVLNAALATCRLFFTHNSDALSDRKFYKIQLTTSGRVLTLMTAFQVVKKSPAPHATLHFITLFTGDHRWTLSWARLIQSTTSSAPALKSIEIWLSPLFLSPPNDLVSSGFPNKIQKAFLSCPCPCYKSRPSDPSSLHHPNSIWWSVRVMKRLPVHFPRLPVTFSYVQTLSSSSCSHTPLSPLSTFPLSVRGDIAESCDYLLQLCNQRKPIVAKLCPEPLRGCVIPRARNLTGEKSCRRWMWSVAWRFWFPSSVENRIHWFPYHDVTTYASLMKPSQTRFRQIRACLQIEPSEFDFVSLFSVPETKSLIQMDLFWKIVKTFREMRWRNLRKAFRNNCRDTGMCVCSQKTGTLIWATLTKR
jgi:hypothetical protein